MIVSRAPMRISLVGGGSDYPAHFEKHGGSVLGLAIDSYVYVLSHELPPSAEEAYRFTYRRTESVNDYEKFQHPVIRESLRYLKWQRPMNFSTLADLPGNSGLGSSSAFTVSLMALLYENRQESKSKLELACEAIRIERQILGEEGGYQDQIFSAFGGFNRIDFNRDGSIEVKSLIFASELIDLLIKYMMLVPIGGQRLSRKYAKYYVESLKEKTTQETTKEMAQLSLEASLIFENEGEIENRIRSISEIVSLAWSLKLRANPNADLGSSQSMIDYAIKNGALAGKLCGAGGSGYVLLLCDPLLQDELAKTLKLKYWLNPSLDYYGAQIQHLDFAYRTNSSKWRVDPL